MNRYIYIFLINFFYLHQYAQISDSFNDTAWLQTTIWHGQLEDFKINTEGQLQSVGRSTGESMIYTFSSPASFTIDAWLNLGFAPSENNKVRIYVQADDTVLANANGYFLEIGDNGSADAIQLYRQSNGKATLLAEGTAGAVADEPALARLNITKSNKGTWSLKADYAGGHLYVEEWSVQDDFVPFDSVKNIFAIQCFYTSTRRDRFYFDDIRIQFENEDKDPPALIAIESDSSAVTMTFDEPLDSVSALDTENYVVDNSIGQPWKVEFKSPNSVQIYFIRKFTIGTSYQILCKRIIDRTGNGINNLRGIWIHKTRQRIQLNELLITELMIDPNPVVGLPNYEYIEIYNHSSRTIDLAELKLMVDLTSYLMDTATLLLTPGAFLLLCSTEAYASLNPILAAYAPSAVLHPLKRWPNLRNTFGQVMLADLNELIIDSLSYTDQWYRDGIKKNGGWSLEMINPNQSCDQLLNWRAANNAAGGTPGTSNSVWNTTYYEPLLLDSTIVIDDVTMYIYLNQAIGPIDAREVMTLPSLIIQTINQTNRRLEIKWSTGLVSGIAYKVSIRSKDCTGRLFNEVSSIISKNESLSRNDLIINEILFDPISGGSDYIEIFNRSNKILSLNNAVIANTLNRQERKIASTAMILPGTYWVLSPDPSFILRQYRVAHPEQMLIQSLPSLPDDQGQISLWSANRVLIDSFVYHRSMHQELLNSREGVALERIDAEKASIRSNWHSASGASGYGTPTTKNSVTGLKQTSTDLVFSLKTKVFTPNGDGIDDVLSLDYIVPDHGYLARVELFSDRGRLVKRLGNNLSLSIEGSLEWDGTDENHRLMPAGIYILRIEVVHLKGDRKIDRLTAVLSR